jgi:hypothetical protein
MCCQDVSGCCTVGETAGCICAGVAEVWAGIHGGIFGSVIAAVYPCVFFCWQCLVHHSSKGKHVDTLEQLQIQKYHHEGRFIPEQNPHEYNPLSQLLYDTQTHLGNTWSWSLPKNFPPARTQPTHTSQVYSSCPDPGKFTLPLNGVWGQWHMLTQKYKHGPSVTKLFSLNMASRVETCRRFL